MTSPELRKTSKPVVVTNDILDEKKKIVGLLENYLNHLQCIQDTMHEKFTNMNFTNEEFYKLGKLENHLLLCQHFSDSVDFPDLKPICDSWCSFFNIVIKLDRNKRKYFTPVPKKVAAFCLLEGRYYVAVHLLYDAVQLNPADLSTWFTLLWWTVFLEDWPLLGILLKREEIAMQKIERSEGYSAFIDCCRLVYSLHVYRVQNTDPHKIGIEIVEKLKEICLSDKKTYLFSSCKALLRNGLVSASRLRLADLETFGDPLLNRTLEAETCELILQNRLPQFSKFEKSISHAFVEKATKADEFTNADELLRLCSSVADYFESFHKCIDEHFDVGLVREAEAHATSLWKHGLYLGVPYRAIRPLSFIFYTKSITIYERKMLMNYSVCLNALITPITAIDSSSSPSSSRGKLTVVKRVDNILTDDQICAISDLSSKLDDVRISSVCDEVKEEKISLIEHKTLCECMICRLRKYWNFSKELLWIRVMFLMFNKDEFDNFRLNFKELRKQYSVERERFWRSVTARTDNYEEFLSPFFTEHWIAACICVMLRENNENCRMVKSLKDFYLREVLSLSKHAPLRFRSSNLLLTLLLRQSEFNSELEKHYPALAQVTSKASRNINDNTTVLSTPSRIQVETKLELPKAVQLCYGDQKEFGHLFFREWRQRNCLFLAQNLEFPKWCWHRAMYFIEIGTPAVRQSARTCSYAKCGSTIFSTKNSKNHNVNAPLPKFHFASSEELITFVKKLPKDATLVNFTLDDTGTLWLVRCHMYHDPIVLPITNIMKNESIVTRMRQILIQSDESVSTNTTDSVKFWTTRRKLDREIRILLKEWQDLWFDSYAPLLLPLPYETSETKKRLTETLKNAERKFVTFGFSRQSATTLVRFCGDIEQDLWLKLTKILAEVDGVSIDEENKLSKIESFYEIVRNHIKSDSKKSLKKYTFLIVPSKLSFLPWECLPIFKNSPLVLRLPSVHFFQHLLNKNNQIPKEVDGRNSFYVLDPGDDLANTQKRMAAFLEKFQWNGVVGKIPTRQEIQSVLSIHDLFLYMGHGSGGRYFGRSSIRESDCKAVSILMGCSSVCILDEGNRFDGRASLYEYLIAKCPCVVGCLWMVTDGEIDRFFVGLVEYCFSHIDFMKNSSAEKSAPNTPVAKRLRGRIAENITKNSETSEQKNSSDTNSDENKENETTLNRMDACKLLIEGIVEARKACKLPYLTGCAVVCYGLPILSNSVFTSHTCINMFN